MQCQMYRCHVRSVQSAVLTMCTLGAPSEHCATTDEVLNKYCMHIDFSNKNFRWNKRPFGAVFLVLFGLGDASRQLGEGACRGTKETASWVGEKSRQSSDRLTAPASRVVMSHLLLASHYKWNTGHISPVYNFLITFLILSQTAFAIPAYAQASCCRRTAQTRCSVSAGHLESPGPGQWVRCSNSCVKPRKRLKVYWEEQGLNTLCSPLLARGDRLCYCTYELINYLQTVKCLPIQLQSQQ